MQHRTLDGTKFDLFYLTITNKLNNIITVKTTHITNNYRTVSSELN